MKITSSNLFVAFLLVVSSYSLLVAAAGGPSDCPPWGYFGTNGPQYWGNLCPAYALCATGEEQSPINIDPYASAVDPTLSNLDFHYIAVDPNTNNDNPHRRREATIFRTKRETTTTTSGTAWQYNGHTVQMNWPPGDYVTAGPLEERQFNLVQFHFHAPSENHYNDKSYPLEIHMVHQADDGTYAVVAIFFEANNSVSSTFLTALHTNLPIEEEVPVEIQTPDLRKLVADSFVDGYWYFMGSLTTPPCTEGIYWLAATKVMQATQAELNGFAGVLLQNERPRQPLNERVIRQYVPPRETKFSPLIIALSCLFLVIMLVIIFIFIVRYKLSHGTF